MKKNKNPPRSLPESKIVIKKIAVRIREKRIKAGFSSLDKFAHTFGISRTQYARYERGEDMRLSSLLNIIALHDLTIEEFLEDI